MANTLKFGNENWATKKDSILAYNDENANFKPLPFVTSRASTATRVNKLGLIEKVAVGIPRVDYLGNTKGAYLLEPQSTNLIAQSEDFSNSYWTKSGASIQGDASTAGVEKVVNGDFASDSNWTKGAGTTISGGSANFSSATAVSLYQSVSATVSSLVTFNVTNYASGLLNVYVGGSQSVSTQNVSANGNGNYTVLLDFNSGNGNIVFGSSNSFTGSIDNVSVKEVSGFASPSADSPLGAFKLVEGTSNGQHKLQKANLTVSATSNTVSYFIKKAERNKVLVEFGGGGGGTAGFDLSLGAIISESGVTAKIELISSDWYRCSVTFTTTATSVYTSVYTLNDSNSNSYQGDGTSGVYIYGAQVEQQSYPTSYIPTSGSAITKLADTASQTLPDGIIGQTEGTWFTHLKDLKFNNLGTNVSTIILDAGLYYTNSIGFATELNGDIRVSKYTSGLQSSITTIPNSDELKIAISYSSTSIIIYVNGQRFVDSSNTSALYTRLVLNNATREGKFYVPSLRIYNTALTYQELIALTQV